MCFHSPAQNPSVTLHDPQDKIPILRHPHPTRPLPLPLWDSYLTFLLTAVSSTLWDFSENTKWKHKSPVNYETSSPLDHLAQAWDGGKMLEIVACWPEDRVLILLAQTQSMKTPFQTLPQRLHKSEKPNNAFINLSLTIVTWICNGLGPCWTIYYYLQLITFVKYNIWILLILLHCSQPHLSMWSKED